MSTASGKKVTAHSIFSDVIPLSVHSNDLKALVLYQSQTSKKFSNKKYSSKENIFNNKSCVFQPFRVL